MKSILRISAIGLSLMVATLTSNAQIWLPSGVGSVNTSTAGPGLNGVNTTSGAPQAAFDVVGDNHLLIHPTSPLDPFGKFCAAGESGGVPGPINGCDIYGFRAQANLNSFVNVGLRATGGVPDNIPTISFGSFDNSMMTSFPKALEFRYDLGFGGCGNLIASMGGVGFPFQVYGSALASGGSWINSDARFKTDVQDLSNALDLIGQLRGTTYSFKTEEYAERNFDAGTQYGFIAQELQEVLPTAVKEDDQGFLGANYDAVIPILVEGVKELNTKLEGDLAEARKTNAELNEVVEEQRQVLEQQDVAIRQLQQEINAIRQEIAGQTPVKTGVAPEGRAQLFQSRPNPFRDQAQLNYYLPTEAGQATLVIYNQQGVELQRFNQLERGYNNVIVNGADLESGTYIYRLMVDGEVVGSESMILTK